MRCTVNIRCWKCSTTALHDVSAWSTARNNDILHIYLWLDCRACGNRRPAARLWSRIDQHLDQPEPTVREEIYS